MYLTENTLKKQQNEKHFIPNFQTPVSERQQFCNCIMRISPKFQTVFVYYIIFWQNLFVILLKPLHFCFNSLRHNIYIYIYIFFNLPIIYHFLLIFCSAILELLISNYISSLSDFQISIQVKYLEKLTFSTCGQFIA